MLQTVRYGAASFPPHHSSDFPACVLSALDRKARCVVIPIFSTSKENSQSSVPLDRTHMGLSTVGDSMVEIRFHQRWSGALCFTFSARSWRLSINMLGQSNSM